MALPANPTRLQSGNLMPASLIPSHIEQIDPAHTGGKRLYATRGVQVPIYLLYSLGIGKAPKERQPTDACIIVFVFGVVMSDGTLADYVGARCRSSRTGIKALRKHRMRSQAKASRYLESSSLTHAASYGDSRLVGSPGG
jgi:hypothetical protein